MKKIIALFILSVITAVSLFSCGNGEGELFSYQSCAASLAGTLYTDTGDLYVSIELSELDFDAVGKRYGRITFVYPESIAGYTISVSENVTAEISDTVIPCGEEMTRRAREIMSLFALDGELLYSVKSEDGVCTAELGGDTPVTVKFHGGEAFPYEISSEALGLKLSIDGYTAENGSEKR